MNESEKEDDQEKSGIAETVSAIEESKNFQINQKSSENMQQDQ